MSNENEKPKSIDERLEFLLKSTESLHSNLADLTENLANLTEKMDRLVEENKIRDRKFNNLRNAMLKGIATFFQELGEDEEEN